MKILKKIIVTCVLSFLLISLNKTVVLAEDDFIKKIDTDASSFYNTGKTKANEDDLDELGDSITENFSGLGQLLTLIGAGVMVAVVTFMGIKYLTASPDKQAALKQQLIGVVVAGVVIFGAYGIWSVVVDVLADATGTK